MASSTAVSGIGYTPEHGGPIAVSPDGQANVVGPIATSPHGLILGALEFHTPAGTLGIDEMTYTAAEQGFLADLSRSFRAELFVFPALAGAASDPDVEVSRRDVILGALAVTAVGSTATDTATAQSDERPDYPIASVVISGESTATAFSVRIPELVSNVLPSGSEYNLRVDGEVVDTLHTGPDSWAMARVEGDSTVKVTSDAETPLYRRYAARWGSQDVPVTLTLETKVSEYSEGDEITLSGDPIITQQVIEHGDGGTTLKIGDVSIPHRVEDSEDERGYYHVNHGDGWASDRLIYRVGEEPPDSDKVTLILDADVLSEALDDVDRVTDYV